MRRSNILVLVLLGWCAAAFTAYGQDIPENEMPRMKGARLLAGYPPQRLWVTTGDETLFLPPDFITQDASGDQSRIYPSISRDGDTIALARWRGGFPDRIVSVSTYSMKEKKWTIYKTGKFGGTVAISPDGSKLAFESLSKDKKGFFHPFDLIDLKTGEQIAGPDIPLPPTTDMHMPLAPGVPVPPEALRSISVHPFRLFLSWSPDGTQIAYGNYRDVWVWNTQSQRLKRIAKGLAPAWSPDGQWIAYLDSDLDPGHSNCAMIHPDGTGEKVLASLRHGGFLFGSKIFLEEPVWSPDSKKLLLNEMADGEKGTFHIDLLDLTTGKLKRIMSNKAPVYAWAEAR